MKKFLIILVAAVIGLSMTSCLTKTKATVDVTVVNVIGEPLDGETVYMFTSETWNESFRTTDYAAKTAVTDGEGHATFNIQGIYLDVLDKQATLYFALFDQNGLNVIASKAVTVKAGDKKEIEIEKPYGK